jgi:hypothetical protein
MATDSLDIGVGDDTSAGASTSAVETGESSTGMRLVELNGSRGGPIDRGVCVDLLRVRIVLLGVYGLSNVYGCGTEYSKICKREVHHTHSEYVF